MFVYSKAAWHDGKIRTITNQQIVTLNPGADAAITLVTKCFIKLYKSL